MSASCATARGDAVHQAGPVEHHQVPGDRLPRHREPRAQAGRGPAALGEQQVEHPPPGRVAHRGPERVVHYRAHRAAPRYVATYGASRDRW